MGDAAPPILEASAIPSSSAFVMSESAGRLRRIGCTVNSEFVVHLYNSYLNNREAQDRRRNVADPHACKHSDKHVCKEHGSRLRPSLTKNKGSHHLCNIVLGQSCSNGEAAKQKHDNGCPHCSEDIACCLLRFEPAVRHRITSDNTQRDS
jgi:hypothetical protein